jgi:hypothetical protein
MSWINQIKDTFSKRRIQTLGDEGRQHPRAFVDLESARRIGIIVNTSQTTSEDLKLIKSYTDALEKRNKEVLIIEINFHKKSEPVFNLGKKSIFINPSKLNWLDYPLPGVENQIKQHDLDILMNFDDSERMTSKYVCSIAPAKTRTGMHVEGFESCYELMIDRQSEQELKTMIKEFDYFLNMIDK